jgi:hypothetical protein
VALSREFFLTHNVIIQRLSRRTDLIKSLVQQEAQPTDLKKIYNWYNWTK